MSGWFAEHTYKLLNPRLAALEREFNEQSGLADPEDSADEREDDSYYFEEWTEGMLLDFRLTYFVANNQ